MIIIPCHRAKLGWLRKFLSSAKGSVPILVIATDDGEQDFFRKNLVDFTVEIMSCESYARDLGLLLNITSNNKGIINLKKFLGLHWCMTQGVEYTLCIDADCRVMTTTDQALADAAKNYERGMFFAAPTFTDILLSINNACRGMFATDEILTITEKTKNGSLFNWFFDAPCYKGSDLVEFFAYMSQTHGSLGRFLSLLTWPTFDHIVFTYFLLAKRDATMFDYSEHGIVNIPEGLSWDDLDEIADVFGYRPIWSAAEQTFVGANVPKGWHMEFHTDRIPRDRTS